MHGPPGLILLLLSLQVTRHRNSLSEELVQSRREVEQCSESLLRASREKEVLMKDKGSLVVQLTACERENRTQAEEIAALR